MLFATLKQIIFIPAMDAELRYFVTMDKDVMDTNVLNIFIQMGPKMTTAFMTEILKPTTYEVR